MECLRCVVNDASYTFTSTRLLSAKEHRDLLLGYCSTCAEIIRFKRVRYVDCPYKVPVVRPKKEKDQDQEIERLKLDYALLSDDYKRLTQGMKEGA